MSRYEPDRETLPNGDIVEVYGRAHAQRQADATAALESIQWGDSRVVIKVTCKDRVIARVYRTLADDDRDLVIAITPSRPIPPDLHRVNKEQARTGQHRITYVGEPTVDILRAPDDFDLWASCQCGIHRLDRRAILEQIGFGGTTIDVGAVTWE